MIGNSRCRRPILILLYVLYVKPQMLVVWRLVSRHVGVWQQIYQYRRRLLIHYRMNCKVGLVSVRLAFGAF